MRGAVAVVVGTVVAEVGVDEGSPGPMAGCVGVGVGDGVGVQVPGSRAQGEGVEVLALALAWSLPQRLGVVPLPVPGRLGLGEQLVLGESLVQAEGAAQALPVRVKEALPEGVQEAPGQSEGSRARAAGDWLAVTQALCESVTEALQKMVSVGVNMGAQRAPGMEGMDGARAPLLREKEEVQRGMTAAAAAAKAAAPPPAPRVAEGRATGLGAWGVCAAAVGKRRRRARRVREMA